MYRLFDFDGTIYDGDSSVDFYLFCLKKKFSIIKFLPIFLWYAILYILRLKSKEQMKEKFFKFVTLFSNLDGIVDEFWEKNKNKIKKFYVNCEHSKDIIVSASPYFLIKPIGDILGVHDVIASNIDFKTGIYKGQNCHGKEKVNRIKKKYKRASFKEAYGDSLSDYDMVSLADDKYYVDGNEIVDWNNEKIKRKIDFKRIVFLFFIFYLVLGFLISYFHDFTGRNNLLFEADSGRVISDLSLIFGDHYRLMVHPFVVILLQPIILFLSGITQDSTISIIIFSSLISSLSVGFIYLIISKFQSNRKISILISLIFGFAFSNLVFTAGIELYNVAALILICFSYYLFSILNNDLSDNIFGYLVIFGVLLIGVTVTNYVIFLIGCLILLLSKKMNFIKLVFLNIVVIIVSLLLSYFQNYLWHNTPLITEIFNTVESERNNSWVDFNINYNSFKNVVADDFYNSVISSDLKLISVESSLMLDFNSINIVSFIIITIFYLIIFINLTKNLSKNLLWINLFLCLSVIFNFVFHLVYGNSCCFLYSQHFLYLIILLLGINYKNNSFCKFFLFFFLIYQIIINTINFSNMFNLVGVALGKRGCLQLFTYRSLVIMLVLVIIILFILSLVFKKKFFRIFRFGFYNNVKDLIVLVISFILIICTFITVKTTFNYQKFLIYDLKGDMKLENNFSSLFLNLDAYENEYRALVSNYKIDLNYDFADLSFYLFGMGGRNKYIFNDGKLISLDGKIIYDKIKKYKIIPNMYTVVFENNKGEVGKIYEDSNGIFLEIAGKIKTLDDTDIKLYDFSSYKYPNVMKVLYSELLFNIKDNMFRPNILVYDNVWYRDAAIGAMVLEKTNQIDLISEGIRKIDSIYDNQNGTNEADNLGEVLYLVSLIDNPDYDLINNIINEAHRISVNNHIEGSTDSSKMYYYQNIWYQFGLSKLGIDNDLNFPDEVDSYTAGTWWYKKYEHNTLLYDDIKFPYLSWAQYHNTHSGNIYISGSIYPLSYEAGASMADYSKLSIIDKKLVSRKNSPTHVWTAAEMLLFLFDEN